MGGEDKDARVERLVSLARAMAYSCPSVDVVVRRLASYRGGEVRSELVVGGLVLASVPGVDLQKLLERAEVEASRQLDALGELLDPDPRAEEDEPAKPRAGGAEETVTNNTSGGHPIRIVGPLGTGATIAPGSSARVGYDGIDWVLRGQEAPGKPSPAPACPHASIVRKELRGGDRAPDAAKTFERCQDCGSYRYAYRDGTRSGWRAP